VPRREVGVNLAPRSADAAAAMTVTRDGTWLVARLGRRHRVASWAIRGGGLTRAATVAWLRVADGDLRPPIDPRELLRDRLAAAGLSDAVGLLTSADLDRHADETASWRDLEARCVVTAGLGNALRAGDPPGPAGRIGATGGARVGTINLLCRVSTPLTDEGLLEALAVAVEARTAAVLAARIPSRRSGRPATGTGTDCVVIAAPELGAREAYAGKHTAIGHVVGAAVEAATAAAVARWLEARA